MRKRRGNVKLDDNDPLFSEWSSGWQAAQGNQGTVEAFPSLAPHQISLEAEGAESYAPPSPEHRARLQRYVKATVAGCVIVCMAAMVRVGIAHVFPSADQAAPPHAVVAARITESAPAPNAAPDVAAPVAAVAANAPSAEQPSPAAAPGAVVPPSPVATSKTATQEREAARRALERGKLKDAVAAAERASEGDPSDAEAWLILGAAQQELGHAALARDAFRSCLKSAKHGPIRECRAMLR
ncbi:MAG: tetratricopeptide repeat protein [Polyangiaceae bacterium]